MDRRRCQTCGEEKSISGVWYLLATRAGAFVCGTCYHEPRLERASSAVD